MKERVLVIGGGPAGTAAAIRLAVEGIQVTLVEREYASAHKVCGEFLSCEALHYLQRLGVNLEGAGAVPLSTLRLARSGGLAEIQLPFAAMSLTRRCLDDALLRRAASVGGEVRRGCSVERLRRLDHGWRASFASGEEIDTPDVFLACGKHDLRGYPRPAGKQQGMVAFKMYWRLSEDETRSLGQAVELITYRGGYAGLQPVEGGLTNLCCLIRGDDLRRLGKWPELLAHMCQESAHLRQRLHGALPMLAKPLTISSLPYGFVRQSSDGIWYVGDQAVVIPSFTGDGMSLAMHTGFLAADTYLQQQSANGYQRALARQVRRQVSIATVVSKAMVGMPGLAMLVPRLWPGALDMIARQTRIESVTLA